MTPREFHQLRYYMDMSIAEAAQALSIGESTVKAYEAGTRAIPDAVAAQLRAMRALKGAAHAERDVRRAIEDRHERLLPNLYLGETPDGWIGIVERLLDDIEREVPKVCRNGDSFAIDFKEKYGELRVSTFVDHHDDASGKAFLAWLKKRCEQAEREAEKACARCGATGKAAGVDFTRSGWILPLCSRHRILRDGSL